MIALAMYIVSTAIVLFAAVMVLGWIAGAVDQAAKDRAYFKRIGKKKATP